MSTAVTAATDKVQKAVARPLHVLVPLIKKDLEEGKEASARAGLPYYRAAGEKMLEAKSQIKHGEFQEWVRRNFGLGKVQAHRYMQLAKVDEEKFLGRNFSNFSEAFRATVDSNYNKPHTVRPQPWHEPVKEAMSKVDVAILNADRERANRAEERKVLHDLGMQLIEIGFKALATKLHPDKGGSKDAMMRLNQVRNLLRNYVQTMGKGRV